MRYWIYKDSQILGPLEREELKFVQGAGSDSLVCPEDIKGLRETEWLSASEVPELAGLWAARRPVAELGILTEASIEGLPADALGLLESLGGDEGVPPGLEGPPTPRMWDSLLELAATHNDELEKERGRSSNLEARLTDLAGKLARYEEQQNAILERIGVKESLLHEKDREIGRLQRELREVLTRPQVITQAPAASPAAVVRPAEEALLQEKDREIQRLQQELQEVMARPKPAEVSAPAAAAPPPAVEEAAVSIEIVGEPPAAESTPAAIALPPVEAMPKAAAPAPIRIEVPPELDLDVPGTTGEEEIPPVAAVPESPRPEIKLAPATRLKPVGQDMPAGKVFQPSSAPPVLGAPQVQAAGAVPTPVPTPIPQTVVRGEPSIPSAPTPMPAWRGPEETTPTPAPTAVPQTPQPTGLIQPPRTVIFAQGTSTEAKAKEPAASFQELLARTPIPATAAGKAFATDLAGAPPAEKELPSAEPAAGTADMPPSGVVADFGMGPRSSRRRQWKGVLLMTVAVAAFAMVLGIFFMGRDPKEVISLFTMPAKRRVIDPDELTPAGAQAAPSPGPAPTAGAGAAPAGAPIAAPSPAAGPVPGGPPAAAPVAPPIAAADQAAEAVGFAKDYPLGGGRKTVREWLQFSLFPKADEEEWSANPQGAELYFVQYRYFRGGRNARGVDPIIYIFEVDLTQRTLKGTNPAAKQLLAGGVSARPASKSPSRPKPVRRVKRKPAPVTLEDVPQLPLPDEDEVPTDDFNNPAEPEPLQ